MSELAHIFARYGPQYIARFGDSMLPSHRRAIEDIMACQTPAMGGHVFVCDHCGLETFAYHSCRNRACPKCHTRQTEAWLQKRHEQLLDVPYFHLVFTLPRELRALTRSHQSQVYPLLIKAAAQALLELGRDPRYVGGTLAIMAVLHTWTATLDYHPHVHCLVPAGGLAPDKQHWLSARKNFLVPVRALSKLFRGKFIAALKRQTPRLILPPLRAKTPWVVYCKPAFQGPQKVLDYLARYVHRIAITNHRILSINDGKVTFRYRANKDPRPKTMTLPAQEFIRRFVQHVLPKGFHKVRYYGLWAAPNASRLALLRYRLANATPTPPPKTSPHNKDKPDSPTTKALTCPHCQTGTLLFCRYLLTKRRAPP